MAALQALKELTSFLSSAATAHDIGAALLSVSRRFSLTQCILLDMTKLFEKVSPALLYCTSDSMAVELFHTKVGFAEHPFTVQARASEQPFVMSRLRARRGEADDDGWWKKMPDTLRGTDGMIVPVHDEYGTLAWCAGFAGVNPDLSARAMSVMSAAVHAGYARFQELIDSSTPKSPLSPRESECLRWVADGKTDREVGKILEISPRTVRFHINNAKTKLGVATRIQAVAKRASGVI